MQFADMEICRTAKEKSGCILQPDLGYVIQIMLWRSRTL